MELIWVCPLLGTTDYVEAELSDSIRSIALRLLWKYNDQVIELLGDSYGNIRAQPNISLVSVKVYQIIKGRKRPISLKSSIHDLDKGNKKFYWNPEPIGGDLELFIEHVNDLLNFNHNNEWKLIDENDSSQGVFSSSKWRDGVKRVTQIKHSLGYPKNPPIIKVTPPPKDPCFDNEGFLHFALSGNIPVWKKYHSHKNPLIYLIDELYDKYGLDLFFDLET
ncbi:MAG: hypothetical protein GF329_17700 [Candidatus Lokiarchaeota archaeon]|nr:hypothetical protein [Candidatus Lokiarchaeota archaeon]